MAPTTSPDGDQQHPTPESSPATRPSGRRPTRREALIGGSGLVVGGVLGLVARPLHTRIWKALHPTPTATTVAPSPSATTQAPALAPGATRYVTSEASMSPFTITRAPAASLEKGLLFAAPQVSEYRGCIFDDSGEPVWISTSGVDMMDVRIQTYRGKPALTYWTGPIVNGYGQGKGVIVDSEYRTIATVEGHGDAKVDLHEFAITGDDTALITSYPTVSADLTGVGGPKAGYIFDAHVQEIDIATGRLLLDWKASDHIDVAESYQPLGSTGSTEALPYDPYHVNSIQVDEHGGGSKTLLLSARHTHALYSIHRTTGALRWRMNGKKSDYHVASDAVYAWQHHAQRLADGRISLFDNHVKFSAAGQSRGLYLDVDESSKTVTVSRDLSYDGILGTAEGSVQAFASGHSVVGWGTGAHGSEFDSAGKVVLDVDFGHYCYRFFRSDQWAATPHQAPAAAARAIDGDETSMDVYASWNGATEVARWRFLTGSSAASSSLAAATTVKRSGFETKASVPRAAYVQAVALDASGTVLGRSVVRALSAS